MTTASQPKNRFTQLAGKVIENMQIPQTFWSQLFGVEVISRREQIHWESREISEDMATDVQRNSNANANKFNKWTEKMISGVEFHEEMNINEILTSLVPFGEADYNDSGLRDAFATEVMGRMSKVNDKITRTVENKCAKYFETGVITYKTVPDGFDFNRPATSIVDLGAAGYWTNSSAPIKTQALSVYDYFRKTALWAKGQYDWIMGDEDWINLSNTDFFTESKKDVNYSEVERVFPNFVETGATFMGRFEVAGRINNIWVYNGSAKGAQTGGSSLESHLPAGYVVILPTGFKVGEITYFPIDSASSGTAGLPKAVFTKRHYWDELKMSSDTLVKHVKSRLNPIAYYEKHCVTLKVKA